MCVCADADVPVSLFFVLNLGIVNKMTVPSFFSLLLLTCAEAILGARSAVSRAAMAFFSCRVKPIHTLQSAGVVLQQVLTVAAETVRRTPLT